MPFTLKQARRYAEKTQKQVAVAIKVCVDTYRAIEENPENATIKQAKEIAAFLGIPYNDIFFGNNSTLSREND